MGELKISCFIISMYFVVLAEANKYFGLFNFTALCSSSNVFRFVLLDFIKSDITDFYINQFFEGVYDFCVWILIKFKKRIEQVVCSYMFLVDVKQA